MMLTDGSGVRAMPSCAKWSTIWQTVLANALISVSRTGCVSGWKISASTVPGAIIAISPSSGSCSTGAVALRVTTIISGVKPPVDVDDRAADVGRRAGQRRFRHARDTVIGGATPEPLEHREHDRAVAVALGRAQDRCGCRRTTRRPW